MCVTLNAGYLRSAYRGSKNIQIYNQSITHQPSMKRRIFLGLSFYCFLNCGSTKLLRLFSGNLPAMFFFSILSDFFFKLVFSIHSESVLGLAFRLVNENSLNFTSGFVLLCFFQDLF